MIIDATKIDYFSYLFKSIAKQNVINVRKKVVKKELNTKSDVKIKTN